MTTEPAMFFALRGSGIALGGSRPWQPVHYVSEVWPGTVTFCGVAVERAASEV